MRSLWGRCFLGGDGFLVGDVVTRSLVCRKRGDVLRVGERFCYFCFMDYNILEGERCIAYRQYDLPMLVDFFAILEISIK